MEENAQIQQEASDELRRKANFYFFSKVWFNFLLIAIGTLLLAVFLSDIHARAALYKQEKNSQLALNAASALLERNINNRDTLAKIYHEGNQKTLDDIDLLLSNGFFRIMMDADASVRTDIFQNLASKIGANYLFMMTMDGKVYISNNEALRNTNPSVPGYLTQENVNQLLRFTNISSDGSIHPVLVKNQFGTFYFYSKSFMDKTKRYALVFGTDATVIDDQLAVLQDVPSILNGIKVINDGFLFAVDTKDKLFLHYKDGDVLLTGQSTSAVGLSENALQDGYSGTETILGQPYYCFSKSFGDSTILCSAVRTDSLKASRAYVLFWPLLGFVLVMVICLAYAVIVRNDFVRRAVKTNRFVLFKGTLNPLFFDKSVFARVFPLIFAGVLAVFGISFYTQTLVEISGGLAESEVALQEVTARYESSKESSRVIENYYNGRFLSTAKLLSFILEEDSDALNTPSDYYHTFYDENGTRRFLTDDEGNHLKSVSKSFILQELCDSNEIDAIYLFDESGHTISTNTPNWFFTISHNPENQSYPFLQVLNGQKDELVQTHMKNDLGEDSQYFGVAFHYYTTKDDAGNTLYVPRSSYEKAIQNGGISEETGNIITIHRSLLQIELDEDLAGKLLAPTSVDYVLSTNMLDGGAIVLFDKEADHKCLYSPVKASIGQTAEVLGVSPKAFTGMDYYGFNNINGITYFQYFRFLEDYYFATAIPRDGMFTSRAMISILTAGACFVLILILILSVTITSSDEETLYENMSDEQAEKVLNSPIFNIMLPSGRSTSTRRAAARWDNKHIKWADKGPEQKLATILAVIFCLLLVYIVAAAFGLKTSFNDNSVIRYIFSGSWDRAPNIFAFSACALVLTAVVLIIIGFRLPVRIITSFLGTRGETVGRLLLSIVKYGCTIAGVFYCLFLLGVDAPSLLASAGILSLVIGLGAQSLIKDILAGIFIVFEGEFRVGDIVTISDFRGTVMDIGLRTTKIMGPTGNIKIYNNSDISGVLNMTKEASVATCTISIEYGQDIDYVEAVLNRDLPLLQEKNPKILDGPTYAGISNLGASGVDILIFCKCYETDIKGVARYLNKEVLQIFYRNGINVPFPNVTVSQLDMTGRKTMEDFVPKEEEGEALEEEKK